MLIAVSCLTKLPNCLTVLRCCVVFSLYNVQTKLMTQGVSMGRPVVYTGVFDCFRKMVFGCKQLGIQPGGISSVYTGFSPMLLKTVPALGLEMAAMEARRHAVLPQVYWLGKDRISCK